MEYMEQHLHEWLAEELEGFGDDDYVLFDCPGQIELYSHVEAFKAVTEYLVNDGWQVRVIYGHDCNLVIINRTVVASQLIFLYRGQNSDQIISIVFKPSSSRRELLSCLVNSLKKASKFLRSNY